MSLALDPQTFKKLSFKTVLYSHELKVMKFNFKV